MTALSAVRAVVRPYAGTSKTPSPTFVIRQARLPLRRGRCPHRPAVGNRIPAAGHAGPALQGVCVRADRVVRRDRISAGTRAVEHQGTHRGSGQRRATTHRGKLWRHNPLNRKNRKTGCAWDRSARNHSRRARGSLETQFQAAFLVTFVAADKSHPPEAKKRGVPRLRTRGTSGVRRSCGADRVVRPYKGTQPPTTGRRGRRPLQKPGPK